MCPIGLQLGDEHTPERLRELIERAPDYAPPEPPPPSPDEIEAQIERLAQFSIVEYERERRDLAAKLGMRPTILDMVVKAKRRERGQTGVTARKAARSAILKSSHGLRPSTAPRCSTRLPPRPSAS